jgi:hypothetical protein
MISTFPNCNFAAAQWSTYALAGFMVLHWQHLQ